MTTLRALHVEGADCLRCEAEIMATEPQAFWSRRMIGCSVCGNKRCPKATDHRLECTGSNARGQPGSDYT